MFVTNLLTSLENITPVVSVYHWFTDASFGNIYTIYTSTIIVVTCVPNLLASFISTKREYRLVVGIQPSYIVVTYFNFSCASSLTSGIAKDTKLSSVYCDIIGIFNRHYLWCKNNQRHDIYIMNLLNQHGSMNGNWI